MDECRQYASATGAGCFSVKTEGMFLSTLFAHHKALKELQDKIERLNGLMRSGGMSGELAADPAQKERLPKVPSAKFKARQIEIPT